MEKNQYVYNIILSVLSAVIGLLFIVVDPNEFIRLVFVFIGILIIVSSIPYLFTLSLKDKTKEEYSLLIYTIITITIGIILIVFPNTVAYIIAGAFLIILPIYRIATSIDKMQAFKKELVKLVFGVVLIVGGLGTTIRAIMYVLGSLIIALSIVYFVINTIRLLKLNKQEKKDEKDNEVIDV